MIRRSLLILPALVLLGACVPDAPPRTSYGGYNGYNGYNGYGGSDVTQSAGYYTSGGYSGYGYGGGGYRSGYKDGYRASYYDSTGTARPWYGRSPYARSGRDDGYHIYPETPPGP